MMNSKGQAFSTFQLLISAIIALTILVILLGVLGIIPGLFNISQNPIDAMVNKLKDATTKLATPVHGGKVTFKPEVGIVTSENLATTADVGLEKEQICISPGDFMEQTEIISKGETESGEKPWVARNDGSMIKYKGSSREASFTVICHAPATRLRKYIEEDLEPEIKVEWMDGSSFKCACLESDFYKDQKCCLIVLRFVK